MRASWCICFGVGAFLAVAAQARAGRTAPAVAVEPGEVEVEGPEAGVLGGLFSNQLRRAGLQVMDQLEVRMAQRHERMRGDEDSLAAREFEAAPIRIRWSLRRPAAGKPGSFVVEARETASGQRILREAFELRGRDWRPTLMPQGMAEVAERVAAGLRARGSAAASDAPGGPEPTSPVPPAELDTRVRCRAPRLSALEALGHHYLEIVNAMERQREAGCDQVVAAARDYRRRHRAEIEPLRRELAGEMADLEHFQSCKKSITHGADEVMLGLYQRCADQRRAITRAASAVLYPAVVDDNEARP